MGIALAATGIGQGKPLIVLHGLFGTARNWTGIAKRLAAERLVVSVDLRNHGASPWAPSMDYPEMAGDVLYLLDARGFDRADVLGHSMGGKVAMLLALDHPERVGKLVVVDIAPVTYGHTLLHYVEAMRDVDLAAATRRADVDAALAPRIPEAPIRAFLLQNLVQENGRFAWRINLDTIGADMGIITGFPDVSAGRRYDGPALFLAGERSDYIRPGHHDRIRELFPRAVIETVADAGHWVHAEQPERVVERVSSFLEA